MLRPPGYVIVTEAQGETPVLIHVDRIAIVGPAPKRVITGSSVLTHVGAVIVLESRPVIAERMARAVRELGGHESEQYEYEGSRTEEHIGTAPPGKNLCCICGGARVTHGQMCTNCAGRGWTN